MKKFKQLLEDKLSFYNSLVLPWHFMQAVFWGVKYGFPARKLTVIGVTGTNGKTSTSFMIWKMLNTAGYKTALMTTVAWGVPGNRAKGADEDGLVKQFEHMTTVDSRTLNRRMSEFVAAGAEFLVLETSSHAMSQFRTLGIPIEVAVLTNVTHEHLDYHRSFERYRQAKQKLFKKAKFSVINADDKSCVWFAQDSKEHITYGIKRGKIKAKKVKLGTFGVKYEFGDIKIHRSEKSVGGRDDADYKVGKVEIETRIPGEFNVYNSLAAACVGLRLRLTESEVEEGILALDSVEGRMNRIDEGQEFGVIVDYAHTPDAFLKVFASVVPGMRKADGSKKGRIISLTGGAGRRDESTRAERGEISAKYSDVVIFTEDDSRDEPPEEIMEQFAKGAEKLGKQREKDMFLIVDRKKAIFQACKMAKKGDLVLILGKGHEKTILRADGPHKFEDLKVTREALKALKS